ncbi:hypothetical protein V6N13_075645 [Hibiscus sabdariffa]
MAVAAGGAVTVTTTCVRLLSAPRSLAAIRTSSFVTTLSYSKLGFFPVRIRNNEPARKKLLVIRAARTESQGVSLGSRAPNFQLPEPLTGKTWTLEDFESYPALLSNASAFDVLCFTLFERGWFSCHEIHYGRKRYKIALETNMGFGIAYQKRYSVQDNCDSANASKVLNLWNAEAPNRYCNNNLLSQFQVMFICNHCPFVKHLKKDLAKLSNFYMKKGLAVVAISSNSVATHPQDGPQFMAEDAKLYNYPFPYLYDENQDVARDFGAVCTPEFFLFKKAKLPSLNQVGNDKSVVYHAMKDGRRPFELVYHGQFDDSRPSNSVPVTGRDLSLAIDSVLSGQPVPSAQKPSVGCSIKWHPQKSL